MKFHISPFQLILFVVLGLAALLGLFLFSTYTSTRTNNGVGSVVIWGTLPKVAVDAAITEATKSDTKLKSVSYVEKNAGTLSTDLAAAIATGGAPDMVLASQEQLVALAKFLTPIPTSTLSARTFNDTFVSEGGIYALPNGSGYYGIPILVDPLVLYANRAILASNGIPLPPANWEAFTGLVSHVTQTTPNRQITRGLVAFGTYNNVHNARAILSTLFLQTGIPITQYSGGNLFANLGTNTGGSGPSGQAVLGFYTQFSDPAKVSYTWNSSLPDSQQAFINGDLALYFGYASEASFLHASNPNLDFDVAPMPQPATARLKTTYGLVYAFMIPSGAKNPTGAYQAAAILTNVGVGPLAFATGLAPATLSTLSNPPQQDPVATLAYQSALYASGWLSPTPANTDSVFGSMINNVITGRSDQATALTSAEATLGSLLAQ